MLLQIIVLWRRNTFASCTGRHTTTNTDTLRKSSLLNSEVELVPRGRYYQVFSTSVELQPGNVSPLVS